MDSQIEKVDTLLMALSIGIASDIMRAGDDLGLSANRIQYIGGEYNEFPMGGLCETALTSVIHRSLTKRFRAKCISREGVE